MEHLRNLGNTVIVVEHDAEMMEAADWLVDFGPGAGRLGGEIVASAPPAEVKADPASVTGQYLSGHLEIPMPETRRPADPKRQITIHGAKANNLQALTVSIPVGLFTCVTGVSGAGKSSLINTILYPAAAR